MEKCDIGIIGMGVMGKNLALNFESKGYSVIVFNRIEEIKEVDNFINGPAKGKNISGAHSMNEFCEKLKKPRRVFIMVKAGKPVDFFIEELLKYLEKGDIIIDGGNSYFLDTIRRTKYVEEKGLFYIGTGVSGGEEGALKGPSLMPGGSKQAWEHIKDMFQKISARADDGMPCCEYIGSDGAGHFVKMVHNGIEYADMQLICEAYFIMKNILNLTYNQMHKIFKSWNQGELNSYLIEITTNILAKKDSQTNKPIVEVILDKAGQKGTGKWTSQIALDLGIPCQTIAEAVFARCISAIKEERVYASKVFKIPEKKFKGNKEKFIKAIYDALYASKICAYAQGFSLMKTASIEYNWNLDLAKIALIWRGGCIIRAKFLERIKEAYERNPELKNLLLDDFFKDVIEKTHKNFRYVISTATESGVPVPAFSSALSYFDSYRSEKLPANLLQAQRDYFGAHTYERIDRPGSFHTNWQE